MEPSPCSRSTDSWGEDTSTHPCRNVSPAAASLGPTKLRMMCSNGGRIAPRPHDKSLCYVGGETRMVVVDRHITLLDLTRHLSKTLFRSSVTTSPPASSFTLKYQLPSEDLDSLISVTTDEDLENMIEEYERLNSSSRLRLFLFPTNPESVSSIGSFLENPVKSDDWFLNALNGTTSGFSDTSSVNCLLDLADEISLPEKKDVSHKGAIGTYLAGNNSGQDVHSIPDSPLMETTSSFGSASSTPSHAHFPPIGVKADDHPKIRGGGLDEQFSQMGVQKQPHRCQDDGGLMASPVPVLVSGSQIISATAIQENTDPFSSYHDRSEQGLQPVYLKQHHQQQRQQKQSTGFDLASMDSILSDLTITDQSSPVSQIQSSSSNKRSADPTRIQMPKQKVDNHGYHQLNLQQPQFIPPVQYIHHHPSVAVPVTSYYQHHLHQPPIDPQNFMYYIPTRQQPYNLPFQKPQPGLADTPPVSATPNNQTAMKTELPAGVYRTTNSSAPQLVRVPSGYQNQAQHAGYSEIHQPTQSLYYATQAMPPLSASQYQKMTPVEASLHSHEK